MLIILEFLILFLTLLSTFRYRFGNVILNYKRDSTNNHVFIFLTSLLLILISCLRGPFTEDYKNYASLFNFLGNKKISDFIFNPNEFHTEPIFNILNRIVYSITSEEKVMIAILSLLTILVFIVAIRRESKDISLSIFMFVSTGLLFASYNLTRQMLAVSCVLWGAKFLYNKENIKYIFIVLLCTLIHKTSIIALLLIPLSYLKISKKNIKKYIFVIFILFSLCFIYTDRIVYIVGKLMYSDYDSSSYGLSNGIPYTSLVLPCIFIVTSFYFRKQVDFKKRKTIIWFNCLVLYTSLIVFSLKIEMFLRLSYFFSIFLCELYPDILDNISLKKEKIYKFTFIILLFLYSMMSSGARLEYTFFWS